VISPFSLPSVSVQYTRPRASSRFVKTNLFYKHFLLPYGAIPRRAERDRARASEKSERVTERRRGRRSLNPKPFTINR